MNRLVHGHVDPAFRAVREVFEASFDDGQNTVAAVAVSGLATPQRFCLRNR
ncbi:hypothetical protein ACWIGW_32790 [Nocardia brasiliensis]